MPVGRYTLTDETLLVEINMCFKSEKFVLCVTVFHIARIHGSWNQKVDVGVAFVTTAANNPLSDFDIPILASLCYVYLENLVLTDKFFCQETKKLLYSMDDKSNFWTFWAQSLNQHEEKYLLAEVVYPD